MADYYLLTQNRKKDRVDVVYHIPIAATNNFAGVSFRTAVQQLRTIYFDVNGAPLVTPILPRTLVPFLDSGTKTKVENGEVWEEKVLVKFDANLSKAAKKTIIDDLFTAESANILTKIQIELDFWGFEGTVT